MNSLLFKNKISNNEMDKINNNEAIIPIENKRIVFPFNFKKYIIQNTLFNIASPLNIEHNDTLTKNSKISNNIFSPRKKKEKLKNGKDTQKKRVNIKDSKKLNYNRNTYPNNVELFNNNNFETQINDEIMKENFFERNFHYKCSNLESIPMEEVSNISENYDYFSTNYMIKDRGLKKFQGKNVSELNNRNCNINNVYSNERQIIIYNNINLIEHNNIVNSVVNHGYKEKFQNSKWIMMKDDKMKKKIKTYRDFSIKMDKKLNKESVPYINCENELQRIQPLSLKDIDTIVTRSNIKQANEVVDNSRRHFSISGNISPVISKNIKKRKKKNMGACFFNLNNFSCQFLISCNKT
ncbi:conserved Plasmodium protein, unknown function [Plasmodium relictum]|uniref:Uncharacterized protein n=1 Tax=Plasmodium relictum TaxID=85471 RepID=A0A1J1H6M3_PLARL|nr:conserved Plasmodium protein, unknown function [Plasmodium relictum]CRH00561.1 conserved Plasmodium protein, unknown function [Plasmodium relictum]